MTSAADMRGADVLTLSNFTPRAALELFDTARRAKADITPFRRVLDGRSFALLFEKPSLRTKMSFEVGIAKLGGQPVFMDHGAQRLGARESVRDYAKNLERWVDGIIARVYLQTALEEMAEAARCPVINALSDRFHPCQALADLFTLFELAGHDAGRLRAMRLAYVGDGNNVCHSLMHAATLLGVGMTVVTPRGYAPAEDVTRECEAFAKAAGSTFAVTADLHAVEGHDAVYTDVWVSMGQGGGVDEVTRRRKVFAKYTVDAGLMERASRGRPAPAVFMHCLPAQRGMEVTDEVIDSARSVVYDQAENRMWAQNALLVHMYGNGQHHQPGAT
ncbi:MAG: ornithine carbamoyltransferase [Phycisphaerae bacterium]|nr:MAG: ornithine carbamoyltransferase [Phycisphaerae bacterium]